jgi:hypothetical protein
MPRRRKRGEFSLRSISRSTAGRALNRSGSATHSARSGAGSRLRLRRRSSRRHRRAATRMGGLGWPGAGRSTGCRPSAATVLVACGRVKRVVGGDAPRLVAEEVRRRAPSRLLLAIDVSERLPVGVGATRCGWAYRDKRRSTDFGPWRLVTAYLRDSPGPGRYRHCGRGWEEGRSPRRTRAAGSGGAQAWQRGDGPAS